MQHGTLPAEPAAAISPTRAQRLAFPLGLGATAACGCALVALADPGDDGVPLCWSRTLFGVDCPFCGGLRATNALLRGRPLDALGHNVVLAVVMPLAAIAWLWWTVRMWRGDSRPMPRIPPWVTVTVAVVIVAFGIVRNLDAPGWVAWLHSDR